MEHPHLDMSHGIHDEPRVSSPELVQKIAHAAVKNIPGATAAVKRYFNKAQWKIPFALKPKKPVNLAYHLGW